MAHLGWSIHPEAKGRAVPHVEVGTEQGWRPQVSLPSGQSRVFAALKKGCAKPLAAPAGHPLGADGQLALAES